MSHATVLVIGATTEDEVTEALAPFDGNLEVPRYVASTKAELIAKAREEHEWYTTVGAYAEFAGDKEAYIREHAGNPGHIEYLLNYPKFGWDDEDFYRDAIKWEEPENIGPEGEVYSTYNPDPKWDWWVIGGRWDGGLVTIDGTSGNSVKRLALLDLEHTSPTFAVVTPDGTWHERGELGGFCVVFDEKPADEWDAQWKALVLAHNDSPAILVDYHV